MASGLINKELKIKHMTYTATTNATGRCGIPIATLNPNEKIVLRAYIYGTSYCILPYNYSNSSGDGFNYNFIVMDSENSSRVANRNVTLQIDYIEL